MWIRNTQGKKDALLTFAVIGFVVVLAKVLLNGATVAGVSFGTVDPALVGAVLAPTLAAYTTKRVVGGKADAS